MELYKKAKIFLTSLKILPVDENLGVHYLYILTIVRDVYHISSWKREVLFDNATKWHLKDIVGNVITNYVSCSGQAPPTLLLP